MALGNGSTQEGGLDGENESLEQLCQQVLGVRLDAKAKSTADVYRQARKGLQVRRRLPAQPAHPAAAPAPQAELLP